jgi:hypothetical protein
MVRTDQKRAAAAKTTTSILGIYSRFPEAAASALTLGLPDGQ